MAKRYGDYWPSAAHHSRRAFRTISNPGGGFLSNLGDFFRNGIRFLSKDDGAIQRDVGAAGFAATAFLRKQIASCPLPEGQSSIGQRQAGLDLTVVQFLQMFSENDPRATPIFLAGTAHYPDQGMTTSIFAGARAGVFICPDGRLVVVMSSVLSFREMIEAAPTLTLMAVAMACVNQTEEHAGVVFNAISARLSLSGVPPQWDNILGVVRGDRVNGLGFSGTVAKPSYFTTH